ncbi:Rhodanese-related sulfurtransferase [Seinonella peptonophila]|uniref:Rhodanese-related sulfurtransferase n=1 Tax=Seinonella peptonophila TaxID=112248 RepID=A0A1M4THV7_9BACL|nr:rhodanese-like domain-containing protein [Seinonella peptonophila]SHE44026.1 Rhodanese-related sulfurtransferase [Seinonella peptonophila]
MDQQKIKRIAAEEFANKYQQQSEDGEIYLDVRELSEWQEEHLEGFVHIPMQQIPGSLDELKKEKNIYVMCAHGMRSASVTEYLQAQGYENVINIEGGIVAIQKHLK